jgi:hypothetical protein
VAALVCIRRTRHRHRCTALTAGAVTAFDWDVRTGLSRRSSNAVQILGLAGKSVSWDRAPNGHAAAGLTIVWREFGGPPIAASIQSGYPDAMACYNVALLFRARNPSEKRHPSEKGPPASGTIGSE